MNTSRVITIKFVLFFENWLNPKDVRLMIERFGPARWKLVTVPVSASLDAWEDLGLQFAPDGRINQDDYKWTRNSVGPVIMEIVRASGWPEEHGISEYVVVPPPGLVLQIFDHARNRREKETASKAKEQQEMAVAAAEAEAYALRVGGHLGDAVAAHYGVRSAVMDHVLGAIGEFAGRKPDHVIQSRLHQIRESPPAEALEFHHRVECAITRMRTSQTMPPSMTFKLERVCYVDLDEGFLTAVVVECRMGGGFPRYGIWIVRANKR